MNTNLLLIITIVVLFGCNFSKPTDPDDPNFDPLKFSFCDYKIDNLGDVYRSLFVPKTEKAYVDKILIVTGHGTQGKYHTATRDNEALYKTVTYSPPNKLCNFHLKKPPHHIFIFDNKDRLINIETQTKKVLFNNSPDRELLNTQKNLKDL